MKFDIGILRITKIQLGHLLFEPVRSANSNNRNNAYNVNSNGDWNNNNVNDNNYLALGFATKH